MNLSGFIFTMYNISVIDYKCFLLIVLQRALIKMKAYLNQFSVLKLFVEDNKFIASEKLAFHKHRKL